LSFPSTAQHTAEEPATWLSLSQAAAFLGVHPGTLRLWADHGDLPSHRTPGGHRRFYRADLESLLAAGAQRQAQSGIDIVVHSALGRARMQASEGALADVDWYRQFDEPAREQHRAMGRRLLGALLRFLSSPANRDTLLAEARLQGYGYGEFSRRQGLALEDAVRAFLFFRDMLADSVVEMSESVASLDPRSAQHWGATFREVNAFTNEVLLALIHAYVQEETQP
jgi:excisionase family DNA binding protein